MMMNMMSTMTYWMYTTYGWPNTPTTTEDQYNWKQKKTMSEYYKKKKKQQKKNKKK